MTKEENTKNKIMAMIESKGLCGMMNNTKWTELKEGVSKLSFPPAYVLKRVDEEETEYHRFDKDVSFWGDWGFDIEGCIGDDIFRTPFYAIEWIKVRPRYLKYLGRLIDSKAIDETEEFVRILKEYNIPYQEVEGAFLIHGYK